MAVALDPILRALAQSVEPTASQKESAEKSHRHLREILDDGKMSSRIVRSYLSGSFVRDTAIRPIDDVDVIFVIAPEAWSTLYKLFPVRGFFPGARAVLTTFERAIRKRYPDSSLRSQRHSVRLRLYDLDIDVVPAIQDPNDSELISIPELSDWNFDTWIRSAPARHTRITSEINQSQGELFKPLVKLLKQWNSSIPESSRAKSLLVETVAARLFQRWSIGSLSKGLLAFFDFIAWQSGAKSTYGWKDSLDVRLGGVDAFVFGARVLDLTGLETNVAGSLSGSQRALLLKNAIEARDEILRAGSAETLERGEAILRKTLGF